MAALPLGLKPRRVEKFRKCRLTDVGKSEFGEEKNFFKHPQIISSLVSTT